MSSFSTLSESGSAPRWHAAARVVSEHPRLVMALILVVVAVYWLAYGLTQRSIFQDEGISILAAQGIVEHWVPRLPSGYLYTRGYIPHYMVASTIGIFGLNQFAIMLPSLLMGLGSLWLAFLYGKDVLRNQWIGIAVVALLLALQIQTLYATSPRMYMSLQFFTILAVYSGWRGFIQDEGKYRLIMFIAIVAAIFSHKQGIAVAFAIPLAVSASSYAMNRRLIPSFSFGTMVGAMALAVAVAFALLYKVPGGAPTITAYVFQSGGTLGFIFNSSDWFPNGLELKRIALYGLGFFPLAVLLGYRLLSGRSHDVSPTTYYAVAIITVFAMFNYAGTSEPAPRMWFFALPLYAALGLTITVVVAKRITSNIGTRLNTRIVNRPVILALSVAVLVVATLGIGAIATEFRVGSLLTKVVGPPCEAQKCNKIVKAHYAFLRDEIQATDLVISSNPFVSDFYLGRVDGYLRDKAILGDRTEIVRYDYLEDEYFGIPLFDASDLRTLATNDRRVWVITDKRTAWISSEEVPDVLNDSYSRFHSDSHITTYVLCGVAPCSSSVALNP